MITNTEVKMAAAGYCLRKTVPVGGKGDPVCPNTILLVPDKPVTFGRIVVPGEANVRLQSRIAPLMISRKHATISCSSGKWSVVDHESLNGVFVNNNKVQGNTPYELQIGDKIVFGVALDSNPPEFEYTFDAMPKVKKRQADIQPSCNKDSKQRKVLSESGTNVQQPGSSRNSECDSSHAEDKIKAAEEKIEKMKISLHEKEKQLETTEKAMESKLLEQKAELEKEKAELEKSLKEMLTSTLREKEKCLVEQLAAQKAILIQEKEKVEENLQRELDSKLEQKNKELEEKLRNEKAALEKVICEKELQQVNLQVELDEYKIAVERLKDVEANERKLVTNLEELKILVEQKEEELKQQQEVTKKAQETARKTVVEEMEDEFSCIICHELFIRATTLACSHSFCEYCLYSWLNKRNSCPVCRCPVQAQPVHSIVLDNAIAKMVETSDDETKTRRQAILQERAEKGKGKADLRVIIPNPVAFVQRATVVHRSLHHEPTSRQISRDEDIQFEQRRIQAPVRRYDNYRYDNPSTYGGSTTSYSDNTRNQYSYSQRASYNHRGYNGVCFACGLRGHLARGCPYSYRR